ncbi:MAG: FxLYD domain-containing protein [Pseudomonadales bacterium]
MSDRSLAFLIAAAVLILVGGLVANSFLGAPQRPLAVETETSGPDKIDQTRTGVRVRVSNCSRESGYGRTLLEGYVENTGNVDLHYVTVKSIWKDLNGRVIATTTTFAVNGNRLAPGERVEFTDSSEESDVDRCNVEAIDWW